MRAFAIVLVTIFIVLVVCTVGQGDVVYLNTGGKLEGKILTRDPDTGVKIRTINGTVELAADDIDRIEECESVFDLYERKLKETPKDNSEARFKLAMWCKENGLRAEAKKHFEEVIALSPDHDKARAELGYVKTDKGWEVPPKQKKTAKPALKKQAKPSKQDRKKDTRRKKKSKKKKTSKPANPIVKAIRASCNVYVLWCSKTRKAVLIDAGGGSANEVFHYLDQNKLKLTKIIITHNHGDHVGDVPAITSKAKVDVLAHQNAPRFRGLTKTVKDGDTINVGTLTLKVIFTPGHSPGSMCLYLESGKILFAGDTLFRDAIGRTRDRRALIQVIKEKLMGLGNDVIVYPGHGARTTIGAEKKNFGG